MQLQKKRIKMRSKTFLTAGANFLDSVNAYILIFEIFKSKHL